MNNVYEYGGIADVLLRLKVEKEINGVHYSANEPYTFLKDVQINFLYEQNDAQSNGRKPVLSTNAGRPTQLSITGVPLTSKIADLILTREENTMYNRTRREKQYCSQKGVLQLNYTPIDGSIYVYDEKFNKINVQYNGITITSADIELDKTYLVFYQELFTGDKFNFEIPHYPYFTLDIFVKGNTNKISNDVYMHFDAASLNMVPNFNIINGGQQK